MSGWIDLGLNSPEEDGPLSGSSEVDVQSTGGNSAPISEPSEIETMLELLRAALVEAQYNLLEKGLSDPRINKAIPACVQLIDRQRQGAAKETPDISTRKHLFAIEDVLIRSLRPGLLSSTDQAVEPIRQAVVRAFANILASHFGDPARRVPSDSPSIDPEDLALLTDERGITHWTAPYGQPIPTPPGIELGNQR